MSTALPPVFPLIFALSTLALPATEHLVATDKELETAIGAALPGDVILMKEGVWKDAEIVFHAEGTETAPITLQAQVPGKVILSGESFLRIGGKHLVVDGLLFKDGHVEGGNVIVFRGKHDSPASHCRLTNTAIINYNAPPNPEGSSYWISLYGTDNRVDHCFLQGKNDASPTMTVWVGDAPNRHRIDHNYFKDRPALGKNGGESLRVGTSEVSMTNSQTIVEHNLFENCDGEVEIISNKSCENIYRHNTFKTSAGSLVLRHGNRCVVEGNWFLGGGKAGSGGVRVIGEDHRVYNNYMHDLRGDDFRAALCLVEGIPNTPLNGYAQVKRAFVGFNTLVNCEHNIVIGAGKGERGRSLPPVACKFAFNAVQSKNAPMVERVEPKAEITWLDNYYHGGEADMSIDCLVSAEPFLTAAADGIFRPFTGSPLVDATTETKDFAFITNDIEGQSRVPPFDAGSHELSTGPGKHKPLTPSEVGPEWMR